MSKILIVAEKPSAGKDIARILKVTGAHEGYMENEKYIITWAKGHLVGLKDPEEKEEKYQTWNVEDLPLPYDNGLKVLPSAKRQYKIVKSLIKREDVSYLINAGDAGREGLLIQNWIYYMCGNKHPVKILWSSSLTDEAIMSAMKKLHDEDEEEFINLFREAEARAIADQIYGYNYTRALTCLFSSPGTVLSYGRCQTPLLNLIYERDLQIENFKSVPYWIINIEFNNSFIANELDEQGKNKKYMSYDAAMTAYPVCGNYGIVKECRSEEKSEKAPTLLNLAEIQGIMGKKYGLKPDETEKIAQVLYETHKIISYPRTDSRYLSTDLYEEIEKHVLSCRFGKFRSFVDTIDFVNFKMDKAYFNNNKVSDHHALIPTIKSDIDDIYNNKLSDIEKALFDEIVVSLIAIFYPPYQYESTEILLDVSGKVFQAAGTVVTQLGYKEIYTILNSVAKRGTDEVQVLPILEEGQSLNITKKELREGKTKPPARYNPGNIVKLMNKYKIGTSATSGNIIKTLEKRGYIVLDSKKKYKTTELGRTFINIVPDVLKAKELTIEFEGKLAMVNSGELSKDAFLGEIINQIKKNIEILKQQAPENKLGQKESVGVCPICKKSMCESAKSWYCSGYKDEPKCDFTIWKKICNKTITENMVKELLASGKTNLIKGFKSSQGKSFSAYLVIKDDYTIGFKFPPGK